MSVVVLHIPHSALVIPADLRPGLLLEDNALKDEILRMTDWYTDELFRSESFPSVCFPVSRLVVDPERFLEDSEEPMSAKGMGVIYTQTSQGHELRKPLDPAERQRLIDRFYEPHHKALNGAVADALNTFAECMVVDCHSFPSAPLPYESQQDPSRPDLCIGTDPFHTPAELASCVEDEAQSLGLSVAINRPFAGSLVPMNYYGKRRSVFSVMLEINRGLYMDEATGEKTADFNDVRDKVQSLLSVVENWYYEGFVERVLDHGEKIAEQQWDSGGPGAGAGDVTAYEYEGAFIIMDDTGPSICPSREAAIDVVSAQTDATVSIKIFETKSSRSS